MKLLYQTAEWHALAKLHMHTETSLSLLESLTTEFGLLMQNFQNQTCSHFATVELPRKIAAWKRRELNNTPLVVGSTVNSARRCHVQNTLFSIRELTIYQLL